MSDTENTPPPLVDSTGKQSFSPKNAAVALPAGSFDVDTLKKGLNVASRAALDNRDDRIDEALKAAASKDTVLGVIDGAAQPGYKIVEVEHAELGITESIRVFDPEAAETAGTESDPPVEQKG